MAKTSSKTLWSKWLLYIFWGLLSVFALGLMGMFGADMLTQTQAGTSAVADTAQGMDFQAYICGPIVKYATDIIAILAVLMLIVAGITYATSMGGSGTSNAKEMMIAAITGVAFFFIAKILIGDCGDGGGWLLDLL